MRGLFEEERVLRLIRSSHYVIMQSSRRKIHATRETAVKFDPGNEKPLRTEEPEMKFAFLIMGNFDYNIDNATIHGGEAQIIGVADVEEACAAAKKLQKEGVGCIELCGAFGETGAKAIIEATGYQLPIGYITHLPEQNELYRMTFSDQAQCS